MKWFFATSFALRDWSRTRAAPSGPPSSRAGGRPSSRRGPLRSGRAALHAATSFPFATARDHSC
eukprot:9427898-Pyramimonas_sp.AAC.1